MIEKYFIKKDLTLKRYRRFKKRRLAVLSVWVFLISVILTFAAPIISNSKPIYLSYQGKSYYPVFTSYHPKEFGITDSLAVDWRKLELSESDSVVWPPFKWDPFESNLELIAILHRQQL